MRRRTRIGLGVLLVPGVVALALAGTVGWWWRGSVPDRNGERVLPGVVSPVTVFFDAHGVPTVEAAGVEDALRAEGYLHGTLRPFQVELRRRSIHAELAAIAGPAALALDRLALEGRFLERAESDERALTPDVRRCAEAYVAGLNAGLEDAARRPDPQLRVARVEPGAWTVRDVLAFSRRFASTLTNVTWHEEQRLALLARFGPGDTAALWQAAFGEPFPSVPPGTRALLERQAARPAAAGGRDVAAGRPDLDDVDRLVRASNAWAVAPARSASGAPLLAGDPHLDFELPSTWFPVVLRWPGGLLAGASIAGAPGVLIGHNAHVAWSFTVENFDEADLFLVEVDDTRHPTRWRDAGGWHPFEVRSQRVAVRGQAPQAIDVRLAGPAAWHGPAPFRGWGLVERSASSEGGGLFPAIWALNRASNVDEALRGARLFPGPGQNVIVADDAGVIAHAVVGRYPRRRGPGWDGGVPAPLSDAAWDGVVPAEQMPLERNPVRGFVFTANERGLADGSASAGGRALTGDFEPAWRADRIKAQLSDRPHATAEDMRALQLDTLAGSTEDLRAEIDRCRIDTPAARLYRAWDGQMRGSGGALLHELWRYALTERLRTSTRLGRNGGDYFARFRPALGLVHAAHENPWIAAWLDDPLTSWTEGPCDLVGRSLEDAWASAVRWRGNDPTAWDWPQSHRLSLRSLVGIGPLARWFNAPPVGLDGASDAVLAASDRSPGAAWTGQPLDVFHGPSFRMVVDFAAGEARSSAILPGGADEHPGSPHAWDQLADYARGVLAPLAPAPAMPGRRITLTPAGS